MERLTKTYSDGTHGASDSLPCGENSYDYKNLLIEKLGKYEDLEERLNKVYGDCDGLLESMIELLEEHSEVSSKEWNKIQADMEYKKENKVQ